LENLSEARGRVEAGILKLEAFDKKTPEQAALLNRYKAITGRHDEFSNARCCHR
jgi:hypothetical protein